MRSNKKDIAIGIMLIIIGILLSLNIFVNPSKPKAENEYKKHHVVVAKVINEDLVEITSSGLLRTDIVEVDTMFLEQGEEVYIKIWYRNGGLIYSVFDIAKVEIIGIVEQGGIK